MPRTEEANQQIREERRLQILNASVPVFARKGLAATKIVDIAQTGNISLGLLYHYFHNKEEIFAALVERAMNDSMHALQMVIGHPGLPLEKIRLFLQHCLSRVWERPEDALIIQHAFTSSATPEKVRTSIYQQARVTQEVILQLIIEGQATGEVVARDPAELTLLMLACIQGLTNSALFLSSSGVPHPNPDSILHMLHP